MKYLEKVCFVEISDVREVTDEELDRYWEKKDALPIPIMNEVQWEEWDDDNVPFAYNEESEIFPVTLLIHWCPNTEKFYVIGLSEIIDNFKKNEYIELYIEFEGENVRNYLPEFDSYKKAEQFVLEILRE